MGLDNTSKKLQEILADPVRFTKMCWPKIKLYDRQQEVLYSVRDNIETFVHAANEVGKDFIASIAVVWFYASRTPCKVVTSSSGETQLKSILWGEINERIETSRFEFPFEVKDLRIYKVNSEGKRDPRSYVIGQVTKVVENFQGHHLPHDKPRVLAVFDEASGIADPFYEACESWAHRKLIIGNPLSTTNFFFRGCKKGDEEDPAESGGLLKKVIHIDGLDSPNVKVGKKCEELGVKRPHPIVVPGVLSYDEYLRRSHKWDHVKRTMRLDGHFYEGEGALLFPPDWLDLCEELYKILNPYGYDTPYRRVINGETRKAKGMGVDTGAGRDLSCWSIVDKLGLIEQITLETPNTMEVASQTISLMRDYDLEPHEIVFDAGGGGKQISDRLIEQGYNVRAVYFAGSPSPERTKKKLSTAEKKDDDQTKQVYKNKRAELYGIASELCDPGLCEEYNRPVFTIPEDLYHLRQELAIMPKQYDSEGRMFLPPKERPPGNKNPDLVVIKEILGRSPDRADSLCLGMYAMEESGAPRVAGAV